MLKYQWIQFCRSTSLHGWKFTVFPKSSKLERCAWILICLTALITAIYLLLVAWFKFQADPTRIVTESTQYPIYKFVFPAITICSLNKISKRLAYNMALDLVRPDGISVESLIGNLTLLFQLVNSNPILSTDHYKFLHTILELNKKTSEEVFKLIAPPCNQLLKTCIWKGKVERCDSLFEAIKTAEGYCCSFNYFALKNHSFTGTYPNKAPKAPRRVSACGFQTGLEVLINNDPNDYVATRIPAEGVRVFIHNPQNYPDWANLNILCQMNMNYFIGINPMQIKATKNIIGRPISRRKCLFPKEKELVNFSVYKYNNCLVECKIFLIKERCGCTPFYFSIINGSEAHSKICSLEDIPCVAQQEHLMFNESYLTNLKRNGQKECFCEPNCESTMYMAEVSQGIFDATYSTNDFPVQSDYSLKDHTAIRIFFNDLLGTRHRKDTVFSWHTLLGFYGGIMGLFTGFSFMSLIEIFYFSTIRIAVDFINKKRKIHVIDREKSTANKFIKLNLE